MTTEIFVELTIELRGYLQHCNAIKISWVSLIPSGSDYVFLNHHSLLDSYYHPSNVILFDTLSTRMTKVPWVREGSKGSLQ